ncbi:MAG: SUMF1/EgtB/PvdO family nonheme iron enzyme [Thermodesulfobacteriota bacterium]|nr:SUMF1/EgtB/PvdO family nonheme iron enzyme [Thermodesulfobacteriota bacterium]
MKPHEKTCIFSIRVTTVSGSNRVKRGGSWNNNAQNCRSANRNNNSPDNRNNNIGFRLLSTRCCRRVQFMDCIREHKALSRTLSCAG